VERIAEMTSTPCPDEDTYARFLQGILPPERITELERHIDVCPRCAELGAQFGMLYGPAGDREPTSLAPGADDRPSTCGRPGTALLLAELAMVCVHAAAAITVLPAALRLTAAGTASAVTVAAATYAAAWVPLGGLVAAIAAWALWRGRPWAGAVARAHAIASLPSLVLTPLAAFVLQQTGTRKLRKG
jgi:hypothetical protein